MDKKTLFNETLADIVAYAATCGNKITKDDVKNHFGNLIEDDSQYSFIYDYLTINKIEVDGIKPPVHSIFQEDASDDSKKEPIIKEDESDAELSYIKMYLDDIDKIEICNDAQKIELIKRLKDGDTSAAEPLFNSKLKDIAYIAESYRGKGVHYGDLIQEGNIGALLAISDFNGNVEDFDNFVNQRITDAIETIINTQINSDRIGQHLADKLNRLDDVTKELSEKLGRVPELDELVEAMGLSKEEVETLLKTSLDTLSVNEDTQIVEDKNDENDIYTTPSEEEPYDFQSKNDPLSWRIGAVKKVP